MYADKFHTKSRPSAYLSPDEYAAHIGRFGADKVTAFQALRAEFGDPDLSGTVPGFGEGRRDRCRHSERAGRMAGGT